MLAALIWLAGGIALLLKGSDLWSEAREMRPGDLWLWFAIVGGVVFGSLKIHYIFTPACRRNLERIASLDDPKLWLFYRPTFFIALALMIAVGATASNGARGNFTLLVTVATIDFSIGIALLGSSVSFLRPSEIE